MIGKKELLRCSITNFIKFGSRSFTMDELASQLGISKKTIYKFFSNKEDLVTEGLEQMLADIKEEIHSKISEEEDPIVSIILVYEIGFKYLKDFKPSFLFGLKKYYPKANEVFDAFRNDIVNTIILNLLLDAKKQGLLRASVDPKLVCELYFLRVENVTFKTTNFFETYSLNSLLDHLIINNLRGLTVDGYSNRYFD